MNNTIEIDGYIDTSEPMSRKLTFTEETESGLAIATVEVSVENDDSASVLNERIRLGTREFLRRILSKMDADS